MGRLNKKVAIVTGAAVGNGCGIATVFGREGAHVVMLDIQEAVFESAAKLEGLGYPVSAYKTDVCDFQEVKKAVDEAAKTLG